MSNPLPNPRTPEADIDPAFTDRWSPRAFSSAPVTDSELRALFEAARWSPSCFNEQPWVFFYARDGETREQFDSLLVEKNRMWAGRAPVLVFIACRRRFSRNDKPNRHAGFDTGAAWMALALQARKLGIHTHAMAGFDLERSYDVLGVSSEDYEVMAACAVGRRTDPESIDESFRGGESPNDRRSTDEFTFAGPLPRKA